MSNFLKTNSVLIHIIAEGVSICLIVMYMLKTNRSLSQRITQLEQTIDAHTQLLNRLVSKGVRPVATPRVAQQPLPPQQSQQPLPPQQPQQPLPPQQPLQPLIEANDNASLEEEMDNEINNELEKLNLSTFA